MKYIKDSDLEFRGLYSHRWININHINVIENNLIWIECECSFGMFLEWMCFSHCHLTAPRNAAAPRSAGWSLFRTSCHDFHHNSAASIHPVPKSSCLRMFMAFQAPNESCWWRFTTMLGTRLISPDYSLGLFFPPSVNWGLFNPGHDQKTMNPHCSTVLRPQRELVPSAPRHLWQISTPKVWNFISPHLEMFCLKICSWHPNTKQKKTKPPCQFMILIFPMIFPRLFTIFPPRTLALFSGIPPEVPSRAAKPRPLSRTLEHP